MGGPNTWETLINDYSRCLCSLHWAPTLLRELCWWVVDGLLLVVHLLMLLVADQQQGGPERKEHRSPGHAVAPVELPVPQPVAVHGEEEADGEADQGGQLAED